MKPELVRRQAALDKTMAKYRGRPFAWDGANCLAMLRSHLVAMGHKRLPKLPRFNTAAGATRALKEHGFDDLSALLDGLLSRIAPAAMLPGDVALMGGEGPLDAIVISVGHKVWGWHGDDLSQPWAITPFGFKGAWRA